MSKKGGGSEFDLDDLAAIITALDHLGSSDKMTSEWMLKGLLSNRKPERTQSFRFLSSCTFGCPRLQGRLGRDKQWKTRGNREDETS